MWMPIVLLEHFPNLQLAKTISNPFRLHYNVLVLIEVKESQEDSYYNAIPPNSSELPEDSNSYDANQDSYISRNPEPLIKYAASSSSMLQKYPLKSNDTLTINIHPADNTQLFFISFDIL